MNEKIEIIKASTDIPYAQVIEMQEDYVAKIAKENHKEILILCEHAPVYTAGTSADFEDVLGKYNIPVEKSGRGGQITYHGPGQRVLYPLINLNNREKDLRKYIDNLQNWIIECLGEFGIEAYTSDDVGVWVKTNTGEKKIAAIGVRIRKWVTFHGIALNVCPNLDHFSGIIPCGITTKGVTSMADLGVNVNLDDVDKVLLRLLPKYFP